MLLIPSKVVVLFSVIEDRGGYFIGHIWYMVYSEICSLHLTHPLRKSEAGSWV